MRITKVYTRTGDTGTTRLAGGQEVPKDHARVEAYGTVDELNAAIGVVRAFDERKEQRLQEELRWIQNKLFDLGGILATAPGQLIWNMPAIRESDVSRLEELMDRCQTELEPLREFILPGGGKVPALLHQARTISRRAERLCVTLARVEPLDPVLVKYLNRLGDALFVLARWVAKRHGEPECLWERTVAERQQR